MEIGLCGSGRFEVFSDRILVFRILLGFAHPKHETIIVKEKNALYHEGYNGTSNLVLLTSMGVGRNRFVQLLFYSVLAYPTYILNKHGTSLFCSVLSHVILRTKSTLISAITFNSFFTHFDLNPLFYVDAKLSNYIIVFITLKKMPNKMSTKK